LCASFSVADAHELDKAQEANAQADGNGFPFDARGSPCFAQARGEALLVVLSIFLISSRSASKWSSLLDTEVYAVLKLAI
jgi:hypothetical protein